MISADDREDVSGEGDVVRFPQSRVRPASGGQPFRRLGTGAFSMRFGSPERQTTGHWCSKCQGIWFGYLLEVTCPKCGNRHG